MSSREMERLRQVANCYADIVRQVAECFVTEFEGDGSPCWAGKSPSLWVLDNLDAIKGTATLKAELEKHAALVEAVEKAVAAWESHNFDGTPEAVAMERAIVKCEDIIRQGQFKEQDNA